MGQQQNKPNQQGGKNIPGQQTPNLKNPNQQGGQGNWNNPQQRPGTTGTTGGKTDERGGKGGQGGQF